MKIDPVCGMEIDEGEAAVAPKSLFRGKWHCFCSLDCKAEFDAVPDDYVDDE